MPEDISVVSFDDSDLASWLQPQLTSVAIPHFEMGRRAVEILLSEQRPPEVHLVPMTLRERASIGAPSRRRAGTPGPGGRRRYPAQPDRPAASVGPPAGRSAGQGQPMVAVSSGVVTPLPRIE